LAPPGFSLDLESVEGGPLRHVTARGVVLPDGTLYWAAPQEEGGLPPYRRTLGIRELEELWSLLRDLGLADPAAGSPGAMQPLPREPVRSIHRVVLGGARGRWGHLWLVEPDEPAPPQVERLVEHLAALAWQMPPPPQEAPGRFDFGPDPYARYRRQ
jgi:hypothetical protein